jgi:hypothetical protein
MSKGTTVDVLESKTKPSCQKQCQKNEKCNWFSFSKEQNICVHLENCPSINENNKYVSGEENCIIPEYSMYYELILINPSQLLFANKKNQKSDKKADGSRIVQ